MLLLFIYLFICYFCFKFIFHLILFIVTVTFYYVDESTLHRNDSVLIYQMVFHDRQDTTCLPDRPAKFILVSRSGFETTGSQPEDIDGSVRCQMMNSSVITHTFTISNTIPIIIVVVINSDKNNIIFGITPGCKLYKAISAPHTYTHKLI